MKKLLGIILVILLVLPSLSLNALSKENNNYEATNNEPTQETLIKKLLRLRLNLGSIPGLGRYFVQQLRPPVAIQAYPSTVNLTYNKKIYFEIGGKDPQTNEWERMVKLAGTWSWAWASKIIKFSFEVVPIDNTSMDVWNIEFNPELIQMYPNRYNLEWPGAYDPFMTNVSVRLKPNVDPRIVTQDVVLKINVIREEISDKISFLKGAPEFIKKYRDEYIQKEEEIGGKAWFADPSYVFLFNLFSRYYFFIINLPLPYYEERIESTVEVLIKVDKYHLAELKAPESTVNIEPYQAKSVPIAIKNRGSHIDTFNFNVNCSYKDMIVTPPPALTIRPGEEKEAIVGIAAPKSFFSADEIASISVEAYSVDKPKEVFSNVITLKISGVYATGGSTINIGALLILILIVLLLYVYLSKKHKQRMKKLNGKQKQVSFYDSITSSIKSTVKKPIKIVKKQKKPKKMKPKKEVKKEKEIQKPEKEKPKEVKKEEKLEKEPPKPKLEEKPVEEPLPAIVKKEPDSEELKKRQAIQRVLQEQKKQKRKYKA